MWYITYNVGKIYVVYLLPILLDLPIYIHICELQSSMPYCESLSCIVYAYIHISSYIIHINPLWTCFDDPFIYLNTNIYIYIYVFNKFTMNMAHMNIMKWSTHTSTGSKFENPSNFSGPPWVIAPWWLGDQQNEQLGLISTLLLMINGG